MVVIQTENVGPLLKKQLDVYLVFLRTDTLSLFVHTLLEDLNSQEVHVIPRHANSEYLSKLLRKYDLDSQYQNWLNALQQAGSVKSFLSQAQESDGEYLLPEYGVVLIPRSTDYGLYSAMDYTDTIEFNFEPKLEG